MAWDESKQTAVDPDNPAANEQIPASEWNAMVAYVKNSVDADMVDGCHAGVSEGNVFKIPVGSTGTLYMDGGGAITALAAGAVGYQMASGIF